jgi:hypothetical protein
MTNTVKIIKTGQMFQGRMFHIEDRGGPYCDIYCDGRPITTLGAWDYAAGRRGLTAEEVQESFHRWMEEEAGDHIRGMNL